MMGNKYPGKESAINRRTFVQGSLSAAFGIAVPSVAAEADESLDSLKSRAAAKGLSYGAEITLSSLRSTLFGEAVVRDCAVIVPGYEMKWGATEKVRGRPNYGAADTLSAFASTNGMGLRGHTALWYRNLPKWVEPLMDSPQGKAILLKRVEDVVSHFRGRIVEWDVVNEALEPNDELPMGLRSWPAFSNGDPGYIAESFHVAASADPKSLLFYNDYGFVYDERRSNDRRRAALGLIEELLKRNAPIHGFGIQSHLKVGRSFDEAIFRKFLSDIAAFGLRISLTELDVNDAHLPANTDIRDQGVADHAAHVLDVAFDELAVKRLVTWGLSDRATWQNTKKVRYDSMESRPLPLDKYLNRKKLWFAIAKAFDDAPARDA